jgi:hypothetical protein
MGIYKEELPDESPSYANGSRYHDPIGSTSAVPVKNGPLVLGPHGRKGGAKAWNSFEISLFTGESAQTNSGMKRNTPEKSLLRN